MLTVGANAVLALRNSFLMTIISVETLFHNLPPNEGRSGTWRGLCIYCYLINSFYKVLTNSKLNIRFSMCKAHGKPIWSLHNLSLQSTYCSDTNQKEQKGGLQKPLRYTQ